MQQRARRTIAIMRASDQTRAMLRWWVQAGVDTADMAIRRANGAMAWHRGRSLHDLPLAWARAENVRQADVYIRPARGSSWPLVFLDDVPRFRAIAVGRKYAALIIRTSADGGCHVWLRCAATLAEAARCQAQRWLAARIGADMGSVSGEHLGRLAGFRNWKRGGAWVNVVLASERHPPWEPVVVLGDVPHDVAPRSLSHARPNVFTDTTPSGKEWGWVCGMLEAGFEPSVVRARLVEHALPRRGSDAARYANQTVTRALRRHLVPRPPTRERRDG